MRESDKYHDLELAAMLKTGDAAAFTVLFERYSPVLYAHLFKRLNDQELARDMVQDIFANLWVKKTELTITHSVQAYLFVSARNKVFDYMARAENVDKYLHYLQSFLNNPANIQSNNPETQLSMRLLEQLVEREIARLPPRMRQVFEMSRKSNMSHRQIAEILNLSEETVRDQIKKALKVLRPRIKYIFSVLIPLPVL